MRKIGIFWTLTLIIIGATLVLLSSCKKKDSSTSDPTTGTVTDHDGNVYKTVKIGQQWWMAENLKTITYNNGISIPLVTDSATWRNLTTPGYCWLSNDISYKNVYGALYNWYTVNTGKLAPTGWHVSSDAEWTILTDFLGGIGVAGGKLKAIGTIEAATGLWFAPNTDATNESGFSALPAGVRFDDGHFYLDYMGHLGYWYSSTAFSATDAFGRQINYNQGDITR
ncbi:MAG TPA: fibrobacter succinogenes major paralogous domain-containing protein, partial [Methylococcales bacterium]